MAEQQKRFAAIIGWGHYVPERVLTNADLERMVDTNDEWIMSRTGIRERRVAAPDETTATLAASAARKALAVARLDPADLDLIIVATASPDYLFPSTACVVQSLLGVTRIPAFDIGAACSGFIYALATATQFIRTGVYSRILVIGAETLTRLTDYTDRRTCVLFGDGAGAVVVAASDQPRGLLSLTLGADGSGGPLLMVPGGGSAAPMTHEMLDRHEQYIKMEGAEVFKFAVRTMGDAAIEAIARAGMHFREIDMLIPHQANLRIIEATAKRLDLPRDKVWVNIDKYGNTSAATIPISLSEAADQGLLHDGSNLLLVAFGGGLTWGASVIRWGRGGEGGSD
ncbi:MAG: beta-ketoacyl-ACP synthase III [Thermomicrobiales bacterium]